MGESIVDVPKNEDKMRVSNVSGHALEVSVSFGKFENDSLSWERWSSFSPNKYLEEVEKCSTPGSVAMKKAYFEAHYKKIAARKAELVDQQKQIETDPMRSDEPNGEDLVENSYEDSEQIETDPMRSDKPNGEDLVENSHEDSEQIETDPMRSNKLNGEDLVGNGHEDSELHMPHDDYSAEGVDLIEGSDHELLNGKMNKNSQLEGLFGTNVEEVKEDAAIVIECESSSVEGVKDLNGIPDKLTSKEREEAALIKEENPSLGAQDENEMNEKKITPKIHEENKKLDPSKKSIKATPANKERNVARIQKKPVSPLPKSPQISTPRVSRPMSTSTMMSPARTSAKKGINSSLPRSKNSTGESRRVAHSSLHMSLSLGPTTSDQASQPTTRKSLIMEKMGDKDIVRRAFRTFQSNINQLKSSGEQNSSLSKQVSRKRTELKVSSSTTPLKDKKGSGGIDERSRKAVSSSFGLKSDGMAKTRKEFSKKLNDKHKVEEAEKTRVLSKSKDAKEAEIKKHRQNLNFKATPLPGFYRGQQLSKSLVDKDGSKNEIHR